MLKRIVLLLSVSAVTVNLLAAQFTNIALFSSCMYAGPSDNVVIATLCTVAPSVLLSAHYPDIAGLHQIETALVNPVTAKSDDQMIESLIDGFFSAMETGSVADLKNACTSDVKFQTHMQDQKGNHYIFDENINNMVKFVSGTRNGQFGVRVDYELLPPDASTTGFRALYVFYLNEQVSHCGVCTFDMDKAGGTWKIKHMVDTRSRACN
jgi:hypothetical protein